MLNVPASVVWAIAILVGVHVALGTLSDVRTVRGVPSDREWWQYVLAFIPSRYTGDGTAFPGDPPGAAVWSFVTHQLVHADWIHLGINCAWLLAFGGAIAARIGMMRFAALGLASGIAGALLFLVLRLGELTPMAGASGAVSGLMGAAFRFFFSAMDLGGLHRFRDVPRLVPRMSLAATVRDRRAQLAVGFFIVVNALTALGAQYITSAGGIAWEAHLGGFFFGLCAFAAFDPPAPRVMPLDEDRLPPPPTLH
jgi:membrane associated rhomboid family serine protease